MPERRKPTLKERGAARSALRRLAVGALLLVAAVLGAPSAGAAPFLDVAPSATSHPGDTGYGLPLDQPSGAKALELPRAPATFNTIERGWIHFSYPPPLRERVENLARGADAFRTELTTRLGQTVLGNVHVRLARTPGEMTTLAPEGVPYPRYASGVAYSDIGLVLLTIVPPVPNALHDLEEVFRHELAHVALDDAIGGGERVPHWFNEGLAVHLSRESSLLRIKTLSTATLAGRLIPLARLDRGFPAEASTADVAYAESADVVRFLLRQEDRERFPALIARLRAGETFSVALRNAYGLELSTLEYEWREDVSKRYSFWPIFFSGSLIWVGVLILFALGWRKRRRQSRETLERWAREEAYAELKRARAAVGATPRVHIVLPGHESSPTETPTPPDLPALPPPPPDLDVPKVQHDGRWHTLH